MKILWVCPTFLHPTTRGGQIRTLETLKQLHRRHEIHFVALERTDHPNDLSRTAEYCTRAYPIPHDVAGRSSPAFYAELARNVFSPLPLAVGRWVSPAMKRKVAELLALHAFDHVVCDFLVSAANVPALSECILFQHNIEAVLWQRRVASSSAFLGRKLNEIQAARMLAFEANACRTARHVIAVSEQDAKGISEMFGVRSVSHVPTGVDIDHFAPPESPPQIADLVFVGSMDWQANVDAVEYFTTAILPVIHQVRPSTTVAIAGRNPSPAIRALSERDPRIQVSGTVPDVRPYFWGGKVSIVPLRIGGGTRLKIYEAMAARIPVVSTTIGAEGLDVTDGGDILIGDSAGLFARHCLDLLGDAARRRTLAGNAWGSVSRRYSWDSAVREFENVLRGISVGAAA